MKKYKVKLIETYAFDFEVEANNRVEAEEKAKEYVDKYQADKFFECATNRVFKIIPKTLNLLCDRKNKSAGNVSNCETRSGREQRRTLSKKRVVKEYSRRFNVWEVARGLNKTKHPAVFPERLANDHILSWSNKGDVVLDPFCGSGTTAKMAMLTGRKFIGFEISAEYCDIAEKRIASVGKDIPLFEAD